MDIEQQSYCMHLYATQGSYPQAELVILLITDLEYNRMVAHSQLQGIIDEFSTNITQQQVLNAKSKLDITWLDKSQSKPRLDVLLTQARQPDKPDSISKIKQELDETKIVLHKTIEAVLERGEKIEDLVAKSTNLSFASKMFYTQVCLIVYLNYPSWLIIFAFNRLKSRTHAASSCKTNI